MKKIFLIVLVLIVNNLLAQKTTTNKLELSYDIKYSKSKYYPDEEKILKVFLPKTYNKNNKYPVVYITDAGTPNFEVALSYINQLMENNVIPKIILIGIEQNNRSSELDIYWGDDGKKFKNYLFEEIIPYINSNYSTSEFNNRCRRVKYSLSFQRYYLFTIVDGFGNQWQRELFLSIINTSKFGNSRLLKIFSMNISD
jgi:hypothetical protein